jgi:hypothetical protein
VQLSLLRVFSRVNSPGAADCLCRDITIHVIYPFTNSEMQRLTSQGLGSVRLLTPMGWRPLQRPMNLGWALSDWSADLAAAGAAAAESGAADSLPSCSHAAGADVFRLLPPAARHQQHGPCRPCNVLTTSTASMR